MQAKAAVGHARLRVGGGGAVRARVPVTRPTQRRIEARRVMAEHAPLVLPAHLAPVQRVRAARVSRSLAAARAAPPIPTFAHAAVAPPTNSIAPGAAPRRHAPTARVDARCLARTSVAQARPTAVDPVVALAARPARRARHAAAAVVPRLTLARARGLVAPAVQSAVFAARPRHEADVQPTAQEALRDHDR
ncbi:hypothetical protein EIN_524580 [Entamoeba invadens IP1]|uniref:Uncharacterized protein n=1 Tax=Entamoeba invadens IP1 TaxID=370355 RepID=L7FPA0_ENTIV|nr:hypothetical protein EIN_524580 [Entamoeba invadens IP1]ELP94500.1 hypothetical protein EIN_524580 [Entamoeba invadens IP1]|eukprot:XP_004261271.1 hypothetical protein EIN_524580 [Entamoeba invadens IP1]